MSVPSESREAALAGVVAKALRPIFATLDQKVAQLRSDFDERSPVPGPAGADGRDGVDGKDAQPITDDQVLKVLDARPDLFEKALATRWDAIGALVKQQVDSQVQQQVSAYLKANPVLNGQDGAPGAPGERGEKGEPGERGERGAEGPAGRDGDMGPQGLQGEKGLDGMSGRDGKDADPEFVVAEVQKAIASMPTPKDGIDGKDGRDVTPEMVDAAVAVHVEKAVAAMPKPRDGRDGEKGADGVGIVETLINRSGELMVTLSNGEARVVGPVVGTKGDPGASGKDGRDGIDGRDGLGFDDMTLEQDEDGRAIAKFVKGDVVKTFRLPGTIDRGVWEPTKSYLKGDGVTSGGSFWIAQKDNPPGRPGTVPAWRLAIKKGSEGKQGPPGTKGKDGRDGLDWTQVKKDGSKW